jgi:hypothetical protein
LELEESDMRFCFRSAITIAAILLLTAPFAVAQETTGGLQGSVADSNGVPIAGAIIEATGPMGKVNTTTDAEGKYRFPRLAAGTYTVTASFVGYQPNTAENVRVTLGEFITVDIGMKQSAFEEEIMVYSDTVAIDFTESATTTSIREWDGLRTRAAAS